MKFHQPLNSNARELFEYACQIPIIDCHEHIPSSEQAYNQADIQFGNLFNPYVSNDLASAGMPFPRDQWAAFVCVEDDWDAFEPYWNAVKHSSYARPIRIALQHFYGVDDLTRENHAEIVRKVNENNTPGIYNRIFREECNIEKAIMCSGVLPAPDDPIVVGNISAPCMQVQAKGQIDAMVEAVGAEPVKTLDDVAAVADQWMALQVKNGAIEFKSKALPVEVPDQEAAADLLSKVLGGATLDEDQATPLIAWLREINARMCAELGVPMALHTGVWQDFRTVDVADLIGFVRRNPDTRFDVYHLGIPNVRDAVQVVKNFPNTVLNLCWAHVVASDMVVNTMKEAIDMVPLNKVFAFGADYVLFIEKVYGHLHMARENVAIILGDRVDRNLMDLDEARVILRAWFYDNPKEYYGL